MRCGRELGAGDPQVPTRFVQPKSSQLRVGRDVRIYIKAINQTDVSVHKNKSFRKIVKNTVLRCITAPIKLLKSERYACTPSVHVPKPRSHYTRSRRYETIRISGWKPEWIHSWYPYLRVVLFSALLGARKTRCRRLQW